MVCTKTPQYSWWPYKTCFKCCLVYVFYMVMPEAQVDFIWGPYTGGIGHTSVQRFLKAVYIVVMGHYTKVIQPTAQYIWWPYKPVLSAVLFHLLPICTTEAMCLYGNDKSTSKIKWKMYD